MKQDNPVLGKYIFRLKSKGESTNLIHGKIQKTSTKVEVTNVDTKEVTICSSIDGAAITLGYHQASISLYLK